MTVFPRLRLAIVYVFISDWILSGKAQLPCSGGGIGGLSLAVALSKLGLNEALEIDIYEAVTTLAQVGAGITVWPRAWDILTKLGLEKPLSELLGFSYRKGDQREGIPIVDVKLPGGPRAFHRADIQQILMDHTSSSTRFHLSHRLEKYTKMPNGIELVFSNGQKAICDLLVGADGINSVVRKCFLDDGNGDTVYSRPSWTGTVVYRSLVDAESIKQDAPDHPGLRSPIVYCGKNKHIVLYPILHGRYVNTIQFISDPSKEGTPLNGPAVVNASQDDIASIYSGWEDDVQCVVKHIKKPSRWAIQTVGPLEKYASGRVVLLGDAAHAMAPHLGNGAAQAIEDGYVLANLLAKGLAEGQLDILRVTKAYNSVRQPFGNFVVNATRQQGRRYELNISGFEDIKEGDMISPRQLAEVGKLIEKGWEWTWKTSIKNDLERALAKL
ncbi:salicylate hydroxylase [Flammula alnicola]|nr:salicylate hydroxylase [Flammula alnicola]